MRPYFFLPNDYGKLPQLTEDAIQRAEQILGVKLPESYLQVLKVQNGGSVRYNTHPSPVPTLEAVDHVPFDHIKGIGEAKGIVESPYFIEEWELPNHLVLLCGDGHWWVALDYRVCGPQGEPSVVYVGVETDPIEDVQLAPSFAVFLDGLVDGHHRHVFGFKAVGEDVQLLLEKVETALGCNFQPSKLLENFYDATHQALLDRDGSRQADLSLRPHRESNGNFDYPWHPECDWLLSCDIQKENRSYIEEKLRAYLPYEVVLIHTPPWK